MRVLKGEIMLNLEEGSKLVALARSAIEKYLKDGERLEPPADVGEKMRKERGVFVTLREKDKLKGCIGRPLPTQTLLEGVVDSSIDAATGDPRFPSLELRDMDNVSVEVSVLTVPEKLEVRDHKECSKRIEIGKDGLIVRYKRRSGLLLPQVPIGRDWSVEDFLSQTCVKAGLSPDSWVRDDVEIEKFSAQVFKEKEPRGEVIEKTFQASS